MDKEMMTQREAGEYMGVSEKTVYNLIQTGDLRSLKVGKRGVRVHKDDLDKYLGREDEKTGEQPVTSFRFPTLREPELALAGVHLEHWLSEMTAEASGTFWNTDDSGAGVSRCELIDKLESDFSDVISLLRRRACME